ncbi:MAG: ABC transporter ATP-binding protein [Trebonia sp.]
MTRVLSMERPGRRYGAPPRQVVALDDVSLTVAAGEMLAVMGPSGSGKTTIVNLIAGIDRPSAGMVTVNGTRLDLLKEEDLAIWRRANVGMVFQFFQLMPTLSALDNTMLPMELARQGSRRKREAHARALLSSVGLTSGGGRLPVATPTGKPPIDSGPVARRTRGGDISREAAG